MPSPRESSKGQQSKRPGHSVEIDKGIEVSPQQVPNKRKADSVGSSDRSLQTNQNVISDPHSIGIFDTVRDVPPCEVNSEGAPIGRFWKHMQAYTHDRAPWLFEWDKAWTRQSKVVKRKFAERIQLLYPRNYDIDFVLEDVATNSRQGRQRIRNHMIKNNSKLHTPIQDGLTITSRNNIWASITNPQYQEKSQKCKVAANARTERMGFTHRLGSVGVAGFINFFEGEFHRVPTDEEVETAKRIGRRALFERIHNRYKKTDGEEVQVLQIKQASLKRTSKKKPNTEPSEDTDEDTASTSSDDEEDVDISKAAEGASSSGSCTSCSDVSDDEGDESDVPEEDHISEHMEIEVAKENGDDSSDECSAYGRV